MRPEQGFPERTRVIKVKGHGKGRCGLIKETNLAKGAWNVLFDDTQLVEPANPYEFDYEQNGKRILKENS